MATQEVNKGEWNVGYKQMFAEKKLTLGIFFPIEAYRGDIPTMKNQEELAKKAEAVGFSALWFRDIPLRDPSFGDVGQIYDPFVYLGYITAHTKTISLATGSIVFPLRPPVELAKASSSVDVLSGGRLVLGIATGDRPIEFPAFGVPAEQRDKLFRESVRFFREVTTKSFPIIDSPLGKMFGKADLIPKPTSERGIPLLITGRARQTIDWIAQNGDGWLYYPQPVAQQKLVVEEWRAATERYGFKPFSQSLYIDLSDDPDEQPIPIHLGYRCGRKFLLKHLTQLQEIGVNHVTFNVKLSSRPAEEVVEELGDYILPHFPKINV